MDLVCWLCVQSCLITYTHMVNHYISIIRYNDCTPKEKRRCKIQQYHQQRYNIVFRGVLEITLDLFSCTNSSIKGWKVRGDDGVWGVTTVKSRPHLKLKLNDISNSVQNKSVVRSAEVKWGRNSQGCDWKGEKLIWQLFLLAFLMFPLRNKHPLLPLSRLASPNPLTSKHPAIPTHPTSTSSLKHTQEHTHTHPPSQQCTVTRDETFSP